jgi:transposase InsO family protein
MIAKPVAHLLADLGVNKSHSGPRVCNDNPYSEGRFRTLKYWPDYLDRFGSFEDTPANFSTSMKADKFKTNTLMLSPIDSPISQAGRLFEHSCFSFGIPSPEFLWCRKIRPLMYFTTMH